MTTIQITESTHLTLKKLKENLNLPSYESVIQWMLKKALQKKTSLYGALGTKSIEEILEGLRDEEDRI